MTNPKFDIATFAPQLEDLCVSAMPAAVRSREDAAVVIEALTAALGTVISLTSQGDNAIASTMISGVEVHLTERCAGIQKASKLIGEARKTKS